MDDGVKRRGTCLPDGCCPSTQQWRERRLIYSLTDVAGAIEQPSVSSDILTARADGDDPGIAVVSLHSIASVRELTIAQVAGTENALRTAAQAIPIAESVTPVVNPPVGPRNTGRGVATPQYRVTFKDGSTDLAVVYTDGNCILSHPAHEVTVEAVTQPLIYNGIGALPATVPVGIIVDAIAAASVAWGEKEGDAAPFGMTTWSQLIEAPGGVLALFERPPFARRVLVIPPIGVASLFDFRSSPTNVIATPPPIANTLQRPQDIPGATTHVGVSLGGAATVLVNCIWEIGVR